MNKLTASNIIRAISQLSRIRDMEGVITSLKTQKLLALFDEAIRVASLIDCIWFKNSKLMPAVIEVEHSTGVTSGLTRILKIA